MKKITFARILLISFVPFNVWADVTSDLKDRLNKVNDFHAKFMQRVIDNKGNAVQEGFGDLWVKRPNLFNWHMIKPDESILISDGETLWFYNPFIEQVTATWLKDIANNTLFMLISDNQANDWQKYNVKQTGDNFILTPKSNNENLKQFTINVSRNGIIKHFSTIEQDGQCSNYLLKYQQIGMVDSSKFRLIFPQNTTVDDQRR